MLALSKTPHLERRHPTVVHHIVQILVDSVEEPQQELLRIVLGIPTVLHGVLGHNVLQREEMCTEGEQQGALPSTKPTPPQRQGWQCSYSQRDTALEGTLLSHTSRAWHRTYHCMSTLCPTGASAAPGALLGRETAINLRTEQGGEGSGCGGTAPSLHCSVHSKLGAHPL